MRYFGALALNAFSVPSAPSSSFAPPGAIERDVPGDERGADHGPVGVQGHAFCGTATECDPTTAPANGTCDGNTLVTCAGGRIHRLVCTEYGFTSCGAMGCQ